jgi:hypothetical protein
MEYSVIEDMEKTKSNVSMYDICNLPQQRYFIFNNFKYLPNMQHKSITTLESQLNPIENIPNIENNDADPPSPLRVVDLRSRIDQETESD